MFNAWDIFLHGMLAIVAFPVTIACAYLGALTLLSARLARPLPKQRTLKFDVLVPAHNETAVITRTVNSLAALNWPKTCYRIVVIADNCTDDTAALARAAGAHVIERNNDSQRGKGYALEYAIGFSAAEKWADAVAVVDADTVVSPNLLEAYAARLENGAQAAQANYGVLNPDDSWRTRLVTIAYGAFHAVRSRARERLHASCGLRGNGMCLTHELLRKHPFRIYSMTEDLEYGIVLGLNGYRVHYVDEASADAELIATGSGSRTQRQRWEGGRFAVMRSYVGRLMGDAVRRRSWVSLELAIDLLTLPLGYIALQSFVLLALALVATMVHPGAMLYVWAIWALVLLAILVAHVLRGWQLTPLGPRALLDLLRAPFFVLWKLWVVVRGHGNRSWIKTERNNQ